MEQPTTVPAPTPVQQCNACMSIGETCCEAAQARLAIANSLSEINRRLSSHLANMKRERDEALKILADMNRSRAAS